MKYFLDSLSKTQRPAEMVVRHGRRLVAFFEILVFASCFTGCGSARPIKYYQLDYPPTSVVASDADATTLVVRLFEASHLYLDDKIVYGFDSPEMGTYETHRWAEPPVEMLQNAIVRGLRSSGQFRAVYTLRPGVDWRFVIAGHLYDFKEVDTNPIVARLNYEVRLWDRKKGTTVWDRVYNHDEPASQKTVTAFALAMDKNVKRSVQDLQAGLEEYFRAHPVN